MLNDSAPRKYAMKLSFCAMASGRTLGRNSIASSRFMLTITRGLAEGNGHEVRERRGN